MLGLPGQCAHRDEVALTRLQDAEEEQEEPSPPGGPGLYLWCLGGVLVMLLLRPRAVALCLAFGEQHTPTQSLCSFNFGGYQGGF